MDAPDRPTRQELLLVLTTEHYNLQSQRMGTISEAGARITAFLATLSGSVVALALIGQVSQLGEPFRLFAAVLLPTVLFIGLATCERLIQGGVEDIVCLRAINRIRHAYLDLAPDAERYLSMSPYDDWRGIMRSSGGYSDQPRRFQRLVAAAGMVAVIDGVLAATLVALAAVAIGVPMLLAMTLGIVVGLTLVLALLTHGTRAFEAADRMHGTRFPTPPA